MADKTDPVVELVEEEEEEWPEAGAQNVEEAEWYQDKINNIFNHLSVLIHEDTKNSSFANHTELQEGCHQTVGQHGGSRYRRGALNHQRPDGIVLEATFDGRGCRGGGPP